MAIPYQHSPHRCAPYTDRNIQDGSLIYPVLRTMGMGYIDNPTIINSGFATGGKISQKINRDLLLVAAYDHSKAQQFHVSVINTAYWTAITGLSEHGPSPITPQTYLAHKLPWFDSYDEHVPTANSASSTTPLQVENLRSITRADQHSGRLGRSTVPEPRDMVDTMTTCIGRACLVSSLTY